MKFPSVKGLTTGALNTIKRFPFECFFALAGTIACTIRIQELYNTWHVEAWWLRIMMVANLGLLLSLSTSLFVESKGVTGIKKHLIKGAVALFAGLLIFIINPVVNEADYIRFFLFSLAFHLIVAYAAFTGGDNIQGFWQFNKTLFLRFLTSALYSVVLGAGLSAAIGALNFLFNTDLGWKTFSTLWAWIGFMFGTLFFLAGVPADTKALNDDTSYPKGLKVFTQYVLIPLATVYLLILLAYEGKILVQWQLPKGFVSHLTLGYVVFGILALLLVYPVKDREENKWLKTYTRSFYFLLIPLLVLLFAAAGTRIFRYGITEMRYFLVLLAVWLLFITVYFLAFKRQNIKMIPVSLSLVTLFAIYGPQSAFSVAMYSQRQVLVNIFKKNHAFKDGRLTQVDSIRISKKDGHKAAATLDYLISKHDLVSLQPYMKADLAKIGDSLSRPEKKEDIEGYRYYASYLIKNKKLDWAKQQLGLSRFSGYFRDGDNDTTDIAYHIYNVSPADDNFMDIKGYDYLIPQQDAEDTTVLKRPELTVKRIRVSKTHYMLMLDNTKIDFDLKPFTDSLTKPGALSKYKGKNESYGNYVLPASALIFTKENERFKVTLKVTDISFNTGEKDTLEVTYIIGSYLIKRK